jgi:uncharacterized protein (UPF0264 family)
MKLLVSVIDPSECAAFSRWPHYLDIKNPSDGSLGMPSPETVNRIRKIVGDRAVISAAIGDATDNVELYTERAVAVTHAGADIIKVGLFSFKDIKSASDFLSAIKRNLAITGKVSKVVCAMYADKADKKFLKDFPAMARTTGMWGCLIDTYGKANGKLTVYMEQKELKQFTADCKKNGVASALAGGLEISDICWLADIAPDIVGFRSAVVKNSRAQTGVDPAKLSVLYAHF